MEPVTASSGWGALHLFFHIDRARLDREPGLDRDGAKRVLDAVESFTADGEHQALCFVALGHKADLGILALGPDLARIQSFQHELLGGPVVPAWSYLSLTEASEYTSTDDDERARLAAEEGVTDPAAVERRLPAGRHEKARYRE